MGQSLSLIVGGSGSGAVTLTSNNTAVCTVSGLTVTPVVGTCNLTATRTGDANYNASTSSVPFVLTVLSAQTITGITTNPAPIVFGVMSSFTVSAIGGGSGNPVTFRSRTPTVCTAGGAHGSTITVVAVGACTLVADQAGNSTYATAPQVTQNIGI